MATKILTYETQLDLLKAFTEGDLKGYMPTEKIDTNKLSYPVKIEAQEGNYTFWLYKEPEVVATPTETAKTETKKGLTKKQKIIIGCSVAGGVILIAIIATLLAIYLPSDSETEANEAETELVIE